MSVADSQLDEFVESTKFRHTGKVSNDWRLRLESSADTLSSMLDDIAKSDNPASPVVPGMAGNLASIHAVLNDYESARNVVEAAIKHFPDDHDLILKSTQIGYETRVEELEDLGLKKLLNSGEDLLLKILILSRRQDWAELSSFSSSSNFDSISGSDGEMAKLLVETSRIRLLPNDKQKDALNEILNRSREYDEHMVVIAQTASDLDLSDIETRALDIALGALTADSHIASRLNVAMAAERRELWTFVIDALDGFIDDQIDTRELRMLGGAFANVYPISDRALRFFEELPDNLKNANPFSHMAAVAFLKAGLPDKACKCIKKSRSEYQNSAGLILLELQIYAQFNRTDDIEEAISNINLKQIEGTPEELLKVCLFLNRFGSRSEALKTGYKIVREQVDNPEAELLYCALILNGSHDDEKIFDIGNVIEGAWIRITDQYNQSDEFIIDRSGFRFSDSIDIANERAKAFIGKKVGDIVEFPRPYTEAQRWEIKEIKSKYIHIFQRILRSFNNKYPGHLGLQSIALPNDDITPFLDLIRLRAEHSEMVAGIYAKNPIPLAMLGAHTGGETIDFLEFLERRPFGIQTCIGTDEEHEANRRLFSSLQKNGAVLDATALWTALRLDSLDIVSEILGPLKLADSTLQDIRNIRERLNEQIGREGGVATYQDGKYYLLENDDTFTNQQLDIVDGYINKIETLTEIVPAIQPDNLNLDLIAALVDEKHPTLIDPIIVSASSSSVLISEDFRFRAFGEKIPEQQTTWLQPIFRQALENGLIDQSRYAELIVKLAELRHGYIPLDKMTIITVVEERFSDLGTIAEYIGDKNAEMRSHIGVVSEVAKFYWNKEKIPRYARKATSLLFEKLTRYRNSDWAKCLALIAVFLRNDRRFVRYVFDWLRNRNYKIGKFKKETAKIRLLRR